MTREIRCLVQNLEDAECDADTIQRFLHLLAEGKTDEQLCLLAKQRAMLLAKVHDRQSKLDCLDYLIYHMKRERAK